MRSTHLWGSMKPIERSIKMGNVDLRYDMADDGFDEEDEYAEFGGIDNILLGLPFYIRPLPRWARKLYHAARTRFWCRVMSKEST